jgi:hypothetical protein
MKVHFCSAHFGSTPPKQPRVKSHKHDLTTAYYTDKNTPSRNLSMQPRLKGKIPKMLEHRRYKADWYVWMDSSFSINNEFFIDDLIDLANGSQFCLYKHPDRSCISDELDLIKKMIDSKDPYMIERYLGEPLTDQVQAYLADPEFNDDKLFAMGFFAYNKLAIPLLEEWFIHNVMWSIQDQISFPYVLSKHNISIKIIENGTIFKNNYVTHRHSKKNINFVRLLKKLTNSYS